LRICATCIQPCSVSLTRIDKTGGGQQYWTGFAGVSNIEQDLQSWTGLAKLPRQRQQLAWQDQGESSAWSAPMLKKFAHLRCRHWLHLMCACKTFRLWKLKACTGQCKPTYAKPTHMQIARSGILPHVSKVLQGYTCRWMQRIQRHPA